MIKTGAISLQSPLLEADPPALYYSIQECYLQEAENSLLGGSFWVYVKELITALVIFRAPVRWWSIQSLFHPFIHPCNKPCRSQESVAIFIFQPRKWGIRVLRCKCRQPKGERRCQPGETALSSLRTVSAPSVKLPWFQSPSTSCSGSFRSWCQRSRDKSPWTSLLFLPLSYLDPYLDLLYTQCYFGFIL